MRFPLKIILAVLLLGLTTSCFNDDRDDNVILASEINDFVWKGMNALYLYKDNIPDLADNRFSNDQEYGDYLNSFSAPEDIFESLIYQRPTVDRFSWIVDDYIALEGLLAGSGISNGVKYYSFPHPQNEGEKILVIRQVLRNSVGADMNLQRGQYINQIDATTLTSENIDALLSQESYTLHHANYDDNGTPETADDTFASSGVTTSLTKVFFTPNPVHNTTIIDVEGEKLGYLMYNLFNKDFNSELNNAFAEFQSNNVQHLVIDLRYNPGGSVNTATLLGSMVTGQFNGEIFTKLVYNSTLQSNNTNFDFTSSFDGIPINSLNLDKVYVLTTGISASASEQIINSLRPYIDVVHIGDTTVGKSQASLTVYDSPGLTNKDGINPNHAYAMQPLVAISINKNDGVVPSSGIIPNISLIENAYNLGQFGDVNEPLLAAAIANIQGTGRITVQSNTGNPPVLQNESKDSSSKIGMYIEDVLIPSDLQHN